MIPRHYPAWLPAAGLVFLALAASVSGLGNQFAQDDFAIIWKSPLLHQLGESWKVFAQPYWPPPFTPDLYRPLALLSYAIQWAIGGGSPLIFRLASYLLYAAVSVQVLRVARLRLPFPAAFAAAALFSVHPVHVEAVAMAVNQAELWVALFSCLVVLIYVRARKAGGPLGLRTELGISGLYLLGCLFKENALMLPALLLAAELILVATPEPWRVRLARGRRLLLLLMLVAVSFFGVRTLVLAGDLVGTFTAEALAYLTVGQRGLTMLAVVPKWFRLLLWPAHLQSDYSPGEILGQTAWSSEQTLGAGLLAGAVFAAWVSRRRAPAITFGLLWAAIALFPVHNVLVPTGIVLAERILFLPSIGAMIALAGGGALLIERASYPAQVALAAALGVLLVLGVYRSTTRHPVWSDQFTLWYYTANRDAPRSYRAHHALAEMYFLAGTEARAEQEYRLAIAYSPPTVSQVYLDYANKLRLRGFCYPAAELYRKALAIRPNNMAVRASLVACLMHLGEYREARDLARMGISYGWQLETWLQIRHTADSALRAKAPAGSVRLQAPTDTVGAYLNIGRVP
ncbi:MAG TPA: tetratricopeptide repeat protein [Gemmatimonadales bacterium]|nr:tetratricopeptide repeat protein [Gemmatimonadales bacterium]